MEVITTMQMISVDQITPHPKNPRKDLGDIKDLTESIKKTGIMQNLTVIRRGPQHYQLLIGHRRYAASKAAGLTEVPCKVVTGLSESEQVSIMLEENMQRNDLTILEQAQGFQMMLDLGNTIDEVAEKSGFSKRTVQHRINIAKLDQDLVEEKTSGMDGKQLSIMDLIELERLKEIRDRNEILKKAQGAYQIKSLVENRLNEIARKENIEKIRSECEKKGMTKAPEEFAHTRYTSRWKTHYITDYNHNTDDDIPEGFPWYHVDSYGIYLVKERKEEKEDISPEQKKRADKEKKKAEIAKQINAIKRRLCDSIWSHIKETKAKLSGITEKDIWKTIVEMETTVSVEALSTMIGIAYDMMEDDDADLIGEILSDLSIPSQMFLLVANEMEGYILQSIREAYSWEGGYVHVDEDVLGRMLEVLVNVFEPNGWVWPDEETEKLFHREHDIFKEE